MGKVSHRETNLRVESRSDVIEAGGDLLVHYRGDGLCGFTTMCGHVDRTDCIVSDSSDPVTCKGCLSVVRTALRLHRAAYLRRKSAPSK